MCVRVCVHLCEGCHGLQHYKLQVKQSSQDKLYTYNAKEHHNRWILPSKSL